MSVTVEVVAAAAVTVSSSPVAGPLEMDTDRPVPVKDVPSRSTTASRAALDPLSP